MTRAALSFVLAIALVSSAAGSAAAQRCVAPPGASAIAQYCETIPGATGERPTRSGASPRSAPDAGDAGAAASGLPPAGPTASQLRQLRAEGRQGRELAALLERQQAEARPAKARRRPSESATAGAQARSEGDDPLGGLTAAVGQGGGLGPALPWAILASTIVLGGAAFLRARTRGGD